MKLVSTLRTRTARDRLSGSGATDTVDETGLRRAAVLTQMVVVVCAPRALEIDRARGPLSIEGSIALALLVVFATSLLAHAVGALTRGAGATDKPDRSPTPTLTLVRAKQGRRQLAEPGVGYRLPTPVPGGEKHSSYPRLTRPVRAIEASRRSLCVPLKGHTRQLTALSPERPWGGLALPEVARRLQWAVQGFALHPRL